MQGILITPVAAAGERLARLQRRGTPVVLVDSRSPSRGQCSVSVDDVPGGELLLLDEALGEALHQHRQVELEPELVIRRSSQPPHEATPAVPFAAAQPVPPGRRADAAIAGNPGHLATQGRAAAGHRSRSRPPATPPAGLPAEPAG